VHPAVTPHHSIQKNEPARAMFEGTQRALTDPRQKQVHWDPLPEPVVESYEYGDMKPLFDKDGPKD
jgi:hypothetical protein